MLASPQLALEKLQRTRCKGLIDANKVHEAHRDCLAKELEAFCTVRTRIIAKVHLEPYHFRPKGFDNSIYHPTSQRSRPSGV